MRKVIHRTSCVRITGGAILSMGLWGRVPGELDGVPFYKVAYHEKLDKPEWSLVRVAQIENYKGMIWATWDPDAPSFLDYLGAMKIYLDGLLDSRDGSEGGSEVFGGVMKWRISCNWKLGAENFAGDTYHAMTSHASAELAGIGPGGKGQERHGANQRNQAQRFAKGLVAFPGSWPRNDRRATGARGGSVVSQFPQRPCRCRIFQGGRTEAQAKK